MNQHYRCRMNDHAGEWATHSWRDIHENERSMYNKAGLCLNMGTILIGGWFNGKFKSLFIDIFTPKIQYFT